MATPGNPDRYAEVARFLTDVAGPGVTVDVVGLPVGPRSLQNAADRALAGRGILKRAVEAQQQGYDAVLLCGIIDPEVDAAREAVPIPVIGAGSAAFLTAAALGRRVGVLGVTTVHYPLLRDTMFRSGLDPALAIMRSIEMCIPDLRKDLDFTLSRLLEEGRQAVAAGADALVLGCTAISTEGIDRMTQELSVPVVHPNVAGVLLATSMVRGRWRHSPLAYPPAGDIESRYFDTATNISQ